MSFLLFETFISGKILVMIYIMGALIIPIIIWRLPSALLEKYPALQKICGCGKNLVWSQLNTKQRLQISTVFFIMFFFAEIIWRMMIEFLMAYMQIRDALVLGD